MGALVAARGYGRLHTQGALETAWERAVGDTISRQTKLGNLRKGLLTITVAHPALLEELAAFQKTQILASLRQALPDVALHDLRFRVGPIE